jgi:AbrB family looped-hinge helix DNA binding protein
MTQTDEMERLVEGVGSNKSQKIRVLAKAGYKQADIARFLGASDQFVSNVVTREKRSQSRSSNPAVSDSGPEGGTASMKVRVGPEGRVVIPAPFREALALKDNDVLFARLENGEIHLLTPQAAARRAHAIIRQFVPAGVSLVDELIAERRKEIEREQQDG